MNQNIPTQRQEKGKEKVSNHEEKKKGAKIEEVNLTKTSKHSGFKKKNGEIFFKSFDSMFLIAKYGYVMSS